VRLPHGGFGRIARLNYFARFRYTCLHITVIEAIAIVAIPVRLVLIVHGDNDALGSAILHPAGIPGRRRTGRLTGGVGPPIDRRTLIQDLLNAGSRADQGLTGLRCARDKRVRVGQYQVLATCGRNQDGRLQLGA
jgi:hypothetical protein